MFNITLLFLAWSHFGSHTSSNLHVNVCCDEPILEMYFTLPMADIHAYTLGEEVSPEILNVKMNTRGRNTDDLLS